MSWGYQVGTVLVPVAPVPTDAQPEPLGAAAKLRAGQCVPFQPTMS